MISSPPKFTNCTIQNWSFMKSACISCIDNLIYYYLISLNSAYFWPFIILIQTGISTCFCLFHILYYADILHSWIANLVYRIVFFLLLLFWGWYLPFSPCHSKDYLLVFLPLHGMPVDEKYSLHSLLLQCLTVQINFFFLQLQLCS